MNRNKEFEFLCGDEVWFRNHNGQVVKGTITKVSLTEKFGHWHYNLETSFKEYDYLHDDGRMMIKGVYLINTEEKKEAFRSLEELQKYEEVN